MKKCPFFNNFEYLRGLISMTAYILSIFWELFLTTSEKIELSVFYYTFIAISRICKANSKHLLERK